MSWRLSFNLIITCARASGGIGIRAGLREPVPKGLRVRVSSCPPKIMKVTVNSKKGLKTNLNVLVDKKIIEEKLKQD